LGGRLRRSLNLRLQKKNQSEKDVRKSAATKSFLEEEGMHQTVTWRKMKTK